MYVINVAKKRIGHAPPRHIFRTAQDSILSLVDARRICRRLEKVYSPDLYEITLARVVTVSEYIDTKEEPEEDCRHD